MISKFGILSDVNSSQRAVTCDHAKLQGDGTCKKELQSFYDGNSLTLCDKSAKTLSVSTALKTSKMLGSVSEGAVDEECMAEAK